VTFDVEALYVALDKRRRADHRLWRDIAHEAGISASTFTRMGQGHHPSADNLVKALAWLGETDLKPYITEEAP
jgi:hypothetical protein